eukprot:gnl/Trimastix_PCT/2775.p1 GENE.gnl/Trimastix_PCT/2775~~gnl/Trimastix_PCT/2775.p1  ORF type:complete len:341 (-),score=79.54 gnl/Trimastix_PCT/2775:14-1036(-)
MAHGRSKGIRKGPRPKKHLRRRGGADILLQLSKACQQGGALYNFFAVGGIIVIVIGCFFLYKYLQTRIALGSGTTLKAVWTPGKTFVYQFENTNRHSASVAGAKSGMGQYDFAMSKFRLSPTPNDVMQEFLHIRLNKTDLSGAPTLFDTETDEHDKHALGVLMDTPFIWALTANGTELDRAHMQHLTEWLDVLAEQREQKTAISQFLDIPTMHRLLDANRWLPRGRAVTPGYRWNVRERQPGLTTHMRLAFQGWEMHAGRQCAKLSLAGELERPSNKVNANMKNHSGAMEGHAWFSPALGVVVGYDVTQRETMEMAVKQLKVASTVESHMRLDLLESATQ